MSSCGGFIENIKDNSKKNEEVFIGQRERLIEEIKEKYEAEEVALGVSFWMMEDEKEEWVSVAILNPEEGLNDSTELELAKFVYDNIDTSKIETDRIEVKQSYKKGTFITTSKSINRFYPYYALDFNIAPPFEEGFEEMNVDTMLRELMVNNTHKCETKFLEALALGWNGEVEKANKKIIEFEECGDYNLPEYYNSYNMVIILMPMFITVDLLRIQHSK